MKQLGILIVAALGFYAYGVATQADRDESGAIIDGGVVDAFSVRVGDCFDDSSSLDEISSLPGVPCSDPHDNEAYAVFDLTIASYPAGDSMPEIAHESCLEHFNAFVGKDYDSSTLDIFTLYPTPMSWEQKDREVVCAVYNMDASKLVGSAAGRGL